MSISRWNVLRKFDSARGIVGTFVNWPTVLLDHAGLARREYVCTLRNGLRFAVRPGTDDARVLFEIFVRRAYGDAELRPSAVVVDVGANIGGFALMAARIAGRVIACEAHPANAARLADNIRLNGATNVRVVPNAVAATGGVVLLRQPRDESFVGRYSLHAGEADGALEVPALTLADVIQAEPDRIDLLKVDCQGAEYEILFSSADALRRVRQVIVECERFDNRPEWSPSALGRYLDTLGFDVTLAGNLLYARLRGETP